MESSVYRINKGINNPIMFKGLKGQYITYLAIGIFLLLALFAILYVMDVNMITCLALVLSLGTLWFIVIFRMSDKYGKHGLERRLARRGIPGYLKGTTRKSFISLKIESTKQDLQS